MNCGYRSRGDIWSIVYTYLTNGERWCLLCTEVDLIPYLHSGCGDTYTAEQEFPFSAPLRPTRIGSKKGPIRLYEQTWYRVPRNKPDQHASLIPSGWQLFAFSALTWWINGSSKKDFAVHVHHWHHQHDNSCGWRFCHRTQACFRNTSCRFVHYEQATSSSHT